MRMTRIIASLAIILSVGAANAVTYERIYHGFVAGIPEL
jgi:hypothetical protein